MVLSYSMDKPGPMCRSILDCALVFNAIHGSDPKDPATVTTPFEFRYMTDLRGVRVGVSGAQPESFVNSLRDMGATISELPALPPINTPSINVEGAAAMDFWMAPALAAAEQGGPTPAQRFQNGRTTTALEYLQAQRRRQIVMNVWQEILQDFDIMLGGLNASNQTGHPAAVVQYGFGPRPAGGGGGGRGGGAGGAAGGGAPEAPAAPPAPTPDQPLCTTVFGHLFADDLVLSVAHAYQARHDWHLRKPDLVG
jgi:Asp-tRNA(Asn)/Glu-tRNA(Gln) amidotransferase A subunit family amidase